MVYNRRSYPWAEGTGPTGCTIRGNCAIKNSTLTHCLANPNLSQIKRMHKFLQTSPNLSTHIRWKRNQWLDLPYNNLSETMACLTLDGAGEQTGPKTEFMQNVRKHGIEHHVSKPHRPQQNRAESIIREVKKWWFQQMTKLWVPTRLWD